MGVFALAHNKYRALSCTLRLYPQALSIAPNLLILLLLLQMAVQAVLCELVSEAEFPVHREETGNFSKNRGF